MKKDNTPLELFKQKKARIAVLLGGFSAEREISLRSGGAVAKALAEAGHLVTPIDVKDEKVREFDAAKPDVAFIALHGTFGEDGGVQALLESKRIPYTGSGVQASLNAMDKFVTKELFEKAGVKTAACDRIRKGQPPEEVAKMLNPLGWPVVVKPRAQGSSVGVGIAKTPGEFAAALIEAFKYGDDVLIEKFIAGREMTVGILGGQALPLIEMRPKREFFDYAAKYQDASTEYIVNPEVTKDQVAEMQAVALKAHAALGCEGFSRVDIILHDHEGGYVLEVNSIPGMTERSLVPKAAKAAGIGFTDLCERIIVLALEKKWKW
jgi:D-alanine-D-alanine ligase